MWGSLLKDRIMACGSTGHRSDRSFLFVEFSAFGTWHNANPQLTGEEAESMLFAFEVLTSLVVLPLGPLFLQGINSMGVEAADQGAGRG